jgi:hypothetical protein
LGVSPILVIVVTFEGQLVENVISKWKELPHNKKTSLKTSLVTLVEVSKHNNLQLIFQKDPPSERFIKEKLAKLLVCIARYEWPQVWEDFLHELFATGQKGNTQREIALLAYKV